MSAQLGRLVDEAATRAGLNDYQLSMAVVKRLPDGRTYSSKQVARLRAGEVRHVPSDVVDALLDIPDLDLDETETWAAAGIIPPGSPISAIRQMVDERIKEVAAGDGEFAARMRRRRSRGRTTPPDEGTGRSVTNGGLPVPWWAPAREGRAA